MRILKGGVEEVSCWLLQSDSVLERTVKVSVPLFLSALVRLIRAILPCVGAEQATPASKSCTSALAKDPGEDLGYMFTRRPACCKAVRC